LQSLLSYCIHSYFCISVKGIVVAFYFFEELSVIVWLDVSSTLLTVTMFVIVELQTIFYMSFAGMFTLLPLCRISHTKFQWLISSHCQTKS